MDVVCDFTLVEPCDSAICFDFMESTCNDPDAVVDTTGDGDGGEGLVLSFVFDRVLDSVEVTIDAPDRPPVERAVSLERFFVGSDSLVSCGDICASTNGRADL